MAVKIEMQGVVVSDRMQKSVVVAVKRRVQHGVYGKIQKRTTKLMAHNENDDAKMGDLVAISESKPMSRRKRWSVTRVIERAPKV
ncbi:MAG: 30S ribosomal protein S17 [Acidobacteria bacterium]|jgi:small subunit ribosomal protein S17|nr:30S ribosomal protein S17 [Acidobacteriota bacterium]